jgi:hypothetical protein
MKLRLSNNTSYAVEFDATDWSEFQETLPKALEDFYNHPAGYSGHLHVFTAGRWINAGYGRGKYIIPKRSTLNNTIMLRRIWKYALDAEKWGAEMINGIDKLANHVTEVLLAVNNDE